MTDRAALAPPTLLDIVAQPERAASLSLAAASALLAAAGAAQALLAAVVSARLAAVDRPAVPSEPEPSNNCEHWLTPDAAAAIAGVDRRIIYGWSRRRDWRPFTRRFSRKVL